MSFLASALRDEGGYEFKKALLDALLDIQEAIPESKTDCLFHLCEFIEDCEFTALATRVLHLLGTQGPSMPAPQPASFIRFIYNRVILENPAVRASAVTALAKFATQCEDLRPQIIPLLQRCTDDDDDEVRDRAATFLRMLGAEATVPNAEEALMRSLAPSSAPEITAFDRGVARDLTSGLLPMPVHAMARALTLYQNRPTPGAFSFASLPHTETEAAPAEGGYGYNSEVRAAETAASKARAGLAPTPSPAAEGASSGAGATGSVGSASGAAAAADAAVEALYKIKEFSNFGSLFRSSTAVELTERCVPYRARSPLTANPLLLCCALLPDVALTRYCCPCSELEYLVSVQKHVFAEHIVLAVTVNNTVADVQLERVHVSLTAHDPACGFKPVLALACPKVKHGQPGTAYVALQREDGSVGPAAFACTLRFLVREVDPEAGGAPVGEATPEEYPVNDVEVSPADFVQRVPVGDFRAAWEAMGADNEMMESFGLSFKNLTEAMSALLETLGLAACEGTGNVKPGTPKHAAYLAGTFLGGVKVLGRMQLSLEGENNCILKLAIRSEDAGVTQALMGLIG